MCPRTHLGHICEIGREKEEKLSELCPRTHSGHICKIQEEMDQKLSEVCLRTHSGQICEKQEETDKNLSESCPRTTKDHKQQMMKIHKYVIEPKCQMKRMIRIVEI